MNFPSPLVKGKLIRRYKRFLADVELDSQEIITAYCANTGAMTTCATPGAVVYLSHSSAPGRKHPFTWELTGTDLGFIGINTARTNDIVAEGIQSGKIPELSGYESLEREVVISKGTRIDMVLSSKGVRPDCFVEVKNVTLWQGDFAEFPDAVTERGTKHLRELAQIATSGRGRSLMFFLINRPEGKNFRAATQIDPVYARTLDEAARAGVEILCYRAKSTITGISIAERIPWRNHEPTN